MQLSLGRVGAFDSLGDVGAFDFAEGARLEVGEGLLDLGLGVHHERPARQVAQGYVTYKKAYRVTSLIRRPTG